MGRGIPITREDSPIKRTGMGILNKDWDGDAGKNDSLNGDGDRDRCSHLVAHPAPVLVGISVKNPCSGI